MIKINFQLNSGKTVEVEGSVGEPVMKVARRNEVDGIVAACGGHAECGTCHVYVSETALPLLRDPADAELAMLEEVKAERKPNSRLSCQLELTEELDGSLFVIPDRQ